MSYRGTMPLSATPSAKGAVPSGARPTKGKGGASASAAGLPQFRRTPAVSTAPQDDAPRPPTGPPPKLKGSAAVKGGSKRPALQRAELPAKVAKIEEPTCDIFVYSTSDEDELGIHALVGGEYMEEGVNHGKKYFVKASMVVGQEPVYLYYWDQRHGESNSGWWFGNEVGGEQVWLHNGQHSPAPPTTGWTYEGGDIRHEICVISGQEKLLQEQKATVPSFSGAGSQHQEYEPFGEEQEPEAEETAGFEEEVGQLQSLWPESEEQEMLQEQLPVAPPRDPWEERVEAATTKVAALEIDVTQAMEMAEIATDNDLNNESAEQARELLNSQNLAVNQTLAFLSREAVACRSASQSVRSMMSELTQRVRVFQTNMKGAEKKLSALKMTREQRDAEEKKRALEEEKQRVLESKHSEQLEGMMREAVEKINSVEDEVEKVIIAATPLEIDSYDDMQSMVTQAIRDTEQRLRIAQSAIGEAKRFISNKMAQAKRLMPTAMKVASEEFATLQTKLTEASEKLVPYQNVRKVHEEKMQAKKVLDELSDKLNNAEIEVEKAVMVPMNGADGEVSRETETVLSSAQLTLTQVARLIESKLRLASKTDGPLAQGLKGMQERHEQAHERLEEARKAIKEMQTQAAADGLVREIAEKTTALDTELEKLSETEMVLSEEDDSGADLDSVVADADKVAQQVHAALTEAQLLAKRLIAEAARTAEGPAKAVASDVQRLQEHITESEGRLKTFNASAAAKKRTQVLLGAQAQVSAAEEELQRLAEAVESLSNVAGSSETSPGELKEAVQQTATVERSVQAAIVGARKKILEQAAELRKITGAATGASPEIAQLQLKINTMQQDFAKLKADAKMKEDRVKAREALSEVVSGIKVAEDYIEQASNASNALAEDGTPEALKKVEQVTAQAKGKLQSCTQLVMLKLKSATGAMKEELHALETRISEAERQLASASAVVDERRERIKVEEIISQATARVEKAEEDVRLAGEAELPFLTGVEEMTVQETQKAITKCEQAAAEGRKAANAAKAFITQKTIEVKRISASAVDSCTEEFQALQERLGACTSKMAELERDTLERKHATRKQASEAFLSGAAGSVKTLSETLSKFGDEQLQKLTPEEAKTICEELVSAKTEAEKAVSSALEFVTSQLQDAKGESSGTQSQRAALTVELSRWQKKVSENQMELTRLAKECSDREQKFVARELLAEAAAATDKLLADVEAANLVAAPLLASDKSEMFAAFRERTLIDALRAIGGGDADALFIKLTDGSDVASADQLAAGLKDTPGVDISVEQMAEVISRATGGNKEISSTEFAAFFRERYVCKIRTLVTSELEGGEEVGALEIGEIVEILEKSEDSSGNTRAQCVLMRDGKTAWVSLEGSDGAPCLELSTSSAGRVESVEAYIDALHKKFTDVGEYAKKKASEITSVNHGPLAEGRTKLLQLRMKANVQQLKLEQLKKKVTAAGSGLKQKYEEDQQKAQEARSKQQGENKMKELKELVQTAEAKSVKVVEAVKGGKIFKGDGNSEQCAEICSNASEALSILAEAKQKVTILLDTKDNKSGLAKTQLLSMRPELMRLINTINSLEKKTKLAADVVKTAWEKERKKAEEQLRASLRGAAFKSGKTSDELFDMVSDGQAELGEPQLIALLQALPGHNVKQEDALKMFRELRPQGVRKPDLAQLLQDYRTCVKGVAITSELEMLKPSSVRMLEVSELFEVLEGPREDANAKTKVPRVRGRALRDGTEGWVTVRGNLGTDFLKPVDKPYMLCNSPVVIRDGQEETSSEVRTVEAKEVLELLGGPRAEEVQAEMLLKGTASKDGSTGFITLQDASGSSAAVASEAFFVCKSAIAMTDQFDIQKCGIVRKIAAGEVLESIVDEKDGKQTEDATAGISRRHVRAIRDGAKGWVSIKGSQGTVYVEPSSRHYVVSRETDLRKSKDEASPVIRRLLPGEAFEADGQPVSAPPRPPRCYAHVRTLQDCISGWVCWPQGKNAALTLTAPAE